MLPLNTNDLQHQTFTNVIKNYTTSTNYGTGENMTTTNKDTKKRLQDCSIDMNETPRMTKRRQTEHSQKTLPKNDATLEKTNLQQRRHKQLVTSNGNVKTTAVLTR